MKTTQEMIEEVVKAERERIAAQWFRCVDDTEMRYGLIRPAECRIKLQALTTNNKET